MKDKDIRMKKRLIIGMSGASGALLTVETIRLLQEKYPEVETHLVVTKGAELTLRQETGLTVEDLKQKVSVYHVNENIGASIASGSFHTMGMVIVPCSMKTVAGIVSGYSDNLLLRAADVVLKERRKLVLVAREAPLSVIHLRNLYEASRTGAVIFPPVPAFYRHPQTMQEMTEQIAGRILEQFELRKNEYEWDGV